MQVATSATDAADRACTKMSCYLLPWSFVTVARANCRKNICEISPLNSPCTSQHEPDAISTVWSTFFIETCEILDLQICMLVIMDAVGRENTNMSFLTSPWSIIHRVPVNHYGGAQCLSYVRRYLNAPSRTHIAQFQKVSNIQHGQLRNACKPPATPYRPECETLYDSAPMSYRAPPPALRPHELQQARACTVNSHSHIINANRTMRRQQLQVHKPSQHTYLGETRVHIT